MVSINLKDVYDGGRDYAFEDLPPTTLVANFKVMICDRLAEVRRVFRATGIPVVSACTHKAMRESNSQRVAEECTGSPCPSTSIRGPINHLASAPLCSQPLSEAPRLRACSCPFFFSDRTTAPAPGAPAAHPLGQDLFGRRDFGRRAQGTLGAAHFPPRAFGPQQRTAAAHLERAREAHAGAATGEGAP